MKKQADGTYRVAAPPPTDTAKIGKEIKKTAQEINKSEAMQKVKAGSRELGRTVEKGIGKAAQSAGAKLQEVGKRVENDAKKPK
jgi:hypothetical protein